MLSPSTLLTAGRLAGPDAKQIGYVLRKVDATKDAAGYTVEAPEVARICVRGAKANFSFDERFLVTHHYVDATTPPSSASPRRRPGLRAVPRQGRVEHRARRPVTAQDDAS